jgi:hypothetical protein
MEGLVALLLGGAGVNNHPKCCLPPVHKKTQQRAHPCTRKVRACVRAADVAARLLAHQRRWAARRGDALPWLSDGGLVGCVCVVVVVVVVVIVAFVVVVATAAVVVVVVIVIFVFASFRVAAVVVVVVVFVVVAVLSSSSGLLSSSWSSPSSSARRAVVVYGRRRGGVLHLRSCVLILGPCASCATGARYTQPLSRRCSTCVVAVLQK